MTESPLISPTDLQVRLADTAPPLVIDCSFDLADPAAGERAHAAGHIPGALYLHLDRDLSGAKTGHNGRHPLPTREAFAARMAALGASDDRLVVACDASAGMLAGRLWWMLRWLGHDRVQVLDGGLPAWRAAGGAWTADPVTAPVPGRFTLRPPLVDTVELATLRQGLGQGHRLIVDARAPDRFRGENETLDPVGGHIPGAANRFFRDNLGSDGRFKPAEQLRAEWQALMAGRSSTDLVMQCGSGVSACHNLLALAQAGLGGAPLYVGSWSEWSAQPGAPVALGA